MEEGDIAQVTRESVEIWNNAEQVSRPITTIDSKIKDAQKGEYKHFMLKEIYEQPIVLKDTLDGRITARKVLEEAFGVKASKFFDKTKKNPNSCMRH